MMTVDKTLLLTKLHRPLLGRGLIDRPQLFERLNCGVDCQLTLVAASAGFGKTTLVCRWLEQMAAGQFAPDVTRPAAWLSLDENDSDLNIFLRYFIAAVRTIFPEACGETLLMLKARQPPPPEDYYASLSNDIEQLPSSFILVLDDYHTIQSMEVHDLLNVWAVHWPEPLRLVLISRHNPPLPLARLRAKGQVSEIRAHDLRFTADETAAYLNQALLVQPSSSALQLLEKRFEGWIAGLHLAALTLRSAASPESVLSGLSGENADITGYLVDEVLVHQVPVIHRFLSRTSILNRFCASLCDALADEGPDAWNSRACLDWIERSDLFIVPLDDRREWYRYHHLFQQLLQQRLVAELTPEQVKQLHRRVSLWFEAHGLIDEALQHTLAAGDLVLAARQMGAGLCEVLNLEDRPMLERWLRLLPEEVIQREPWLLMIKAWSLEFSWRLNLQAQVLQNIEALLASEAGAALSADDRQLLRGQILAIKAQQAYFFNQPTTAIDLCRQVLSLMPDAWTFVRGGAMIYLGLSMHASGQVVEAERLLLAEYEACSDKTSSFALEILLPLCFNYLNGGQTEQARRIAQVMLQAASKGRVIIQKNWADWFLGVGNFQINELKTSEQHLLRIIENRFTAQITTYRDAVAGLSLIHQIKGENAAAWERLESISQYDLEMRGSEDERTRSLRARLQLLQGDLESAGAWAETLASPPPDQPLLWLEEPQVTRAQILIARGSSSDLQLALQIVDALLEIVERTHNIRYQIVIRALRAVALHAQGKTSQALADLKQAVELARPGGFIRAFVDLGNPMHELLRQLSRQNPELTSVKSILAAYQENGIAPVPGERATAPTGQISAGNLSLMEPLSPREIEVLTLLHSPMSTKEIALNLHISYTTAKRHTINIYRKLGVSQRWAAVVKAEELNILPPR